MNESVTTDYWRCCCWCWHEVYMRAKLIQTNACRLPANYKLIRHATKITLQICILLFRRFFTLLFLYNWLLTSDRENHFGDTNSVFCLYYIFTRLRSRGRVVKYANWVYFLKFKRNVCNSWTRGRFCLKDMLTDNGRTVNTRTDGRMDREYTEGQTDGCVFVYILFPHHCVS